MLKENRYNISLPLAIGDKVFFINSYFQKYAEKPFAGIISGIKTFDGVNWIFTTDIGRVVYEHNLGKTVFLTREAAEAALERKEIND